MARARTKTQSASRHLVEWTVGAAGALIVIGSIAFLAYKAVTTDHAPPDINVQLAAVRPVSGGYLLQVRIRNDGDTTAAQLKVRGTLLEGKRLVETSEATFDYAPPRSVREGGLFFSNDPRLFEIRVQAEGYEKP